MTQKCLKGTCSWCSFIEWSELLIKASFVCPTRFPPALLLWFRVTTKVQPVFHNWNLLCWNCISFYCWLTEVHKDGGVKTQAGGPVDSKQVGSDKCIIQMQCNDEKLSAFSQLIMNTSWPHFKFKCSLNVFERALRFLHEMSAITNIYNEWNQRQKQQILLMYKYQPWERSIHSFNTWLVITASEW